ncbi:MAG TPA: hypothetical protein PLC98_00855 [Anaerolineales bacterium]|nr:hypothetical protein [Anaerolineales bacterium]
MNKRIWAATALAGLVLAACQSAPAETAVLPTVAIPTETVAALPSETSEPATATVEASPTATASATPENTTTPLPTETPAAPATPDPNQGTGDVVYDERFDGTLGWGWGYSDDVVAFTPEDGKVTAVTTQGDAGWRVTIGPGAGWLDQQITLTAEVTACTESDEYGLLYRGALDDQTSILNGYVFKVTCGGLASVEVLRDNQPSVLVQPTAAQVNPTGENTLTVWAARGEMRFYVNGSFIATAEDSTFTSGRLGLYVRDRNGGPMTVGFTGLALREVTPP